MTRPLHRRIFLRGLGGACVAAPFLGSLGGKGLRAQSAVAPKRLIAMFTHYGCVTNHFFPAKSHGQLTAEDLAPTSLRSLTPHLDKLLLPRGIRAMNEWNSAMSRGQGNGEHTQVCGSYFTCHPVAPNSDEPFSFEPETRFEAMPTGRSLDHVIAEQLSPGRPPLLLRVGNVNDSPMSGISYSAAGTPYAGAGSLSEVYANLTGLFRDGAPMNPDTYAAAKGKSIHDLVRDDLETLERFDMSQADRTKLEAWKALLDDLGGVVAAAQCDQQIAAALGATQANVGAVGPVDSESEDFLTQRITDTLDAADVHANLAVLAAACNASPVILLKFPPYHVFRGLGINYDAHALSHRVGNANMAGICLNGVIDMLRAIDEYHASKFAHLLSQLDLIDEGEGKLLDHTAAVWFQELSDGNAHNLNNIPIVHAGSAGGFFKTGLAVNVEDGRADLSNGNSEAACLDGSMVVSTGTDPSFANAPINKYYVSLMNALGVRAGSDGFATLGGTAEVSKFGMYDRTEDFIGGGSVPPEIHDPGGFDDLEA